MVRRRKTRTVNVWISAQLHSRLKRLARQLGRTITDLAVEAVKDYVAKWPH